MYFLGPIENGNIPASYVSLPEAISFHGNLPPFHVPQPKRIGRPFLFGISRG